MIEILIATPDRELADRVQALAPPDLRVTHVGDGVAALEQLDTTRPDLLVTELWMPELDGFQVLAFLTRNYPDMPVVALSDHASRTLNIRLREMGGLRVALRPAKPETILTLIDELMQQRGAEGKRLGIALSAFLHLADMEKRRCRIEVRDRYHGRSGWLELYDSNLRAAGCDDGSASQAAALQILTWDRVILELADLEPERLDDGLGIDLTGLMVEGVKFRERALRLRKRDRTLGPEEAGGVAEVLAEVVAVPGVQRALLIAHDGFVVGSAGELDADEEHLGAAIGVMVSGAEGMIGELVLSYFESLVLEYDQTQLICGYAGESMLVVVARSSNDNSALLGALPGWGARIARLL